MSAPDRKPAKPRTAPVRGSAPKLRVCKHPARLLRRCRNCPLANLR